MGCSDRKLSLKRALTHCLLYFGNRVLFPLPKRVRNALDIPHRVRNNFAYPFLLHHTVTNLSNPYFAIVAVPPLKVPRIPHLQPPRPAQVPCQVPVPRPPPLRRLLLLPHPHLLLPPPLPQQVHLQLYLRLAQHPILHLSRLLFPLTVQHRILHLVQLRFQLRTQHQNRHPIQHLSQHQIRHQTQCPTQLLLQRQSLLHLHL